MDWISLALALVKLANLIFGRVRDRALEQVGEDREKLRQFHEMQAISSRLKDSDARYDNMTAADIRADIEAAGDFRD